MRSDAGEHVATGRLSWRGRWHRPAVRGPRRSLRMRITAWASIGVVAVLTAAVLAAYVKYRAVWDSIGRVAVTDLGNRPPKYTSALNILVFGSDNRSGLTARQRAYRERHREQH